MDDLTGSQRDALYVIAKLDSPHGLEIKRELEEYYLKDIYHGQLYPNLDELAEKGLCSKTKLNGRSNIYQLTDQGEAALHARRSWEQDLSDRPEIDNPRK